MNNTRRVAQVAAVLIGGLASIGVLLEQGHELSTLGWSQWSDTGVSGLDFILLLITVPAALLVAVVAATEGVGIALRRRAATQESRRDFVQDRADLRALADMADEDPAP